MTKEEFKKMTMYQSLSECATATRLNLIEHPLFQNFLQENNIKTETRRYGADIKENELAFSTMVNQFSPVMETVLLFSE